ncbi:hypothetical protein N7517_005093 [Penicillium concentricum]|uniref:Uncharacterized protein n=1 Tax=Penicillium concentricum TaxID=293559 RepID=A0A9W9S6R9_9EURO|nr:uncharacterized protein N7517_005093 [Penicillium concentricum]KAJ5373087.1 hypothetical protein N7517_005093 [Penicillium concentricum]
MVLRLSSGVGLYDSFCQFLQLHSWSVWIRLFYWRADPRNLILLSLFLPIAVLVFIQAIDSLTTYAELLMRN